MRVVTRQLKRQFLTDSSQYYGQPMSVIGVEFDDGTWVPSWDIEREALAIRYGGYRSVLQTEQEILAAEEILNEYLFYRNR